MNKCEGCRYWVRNEAPKNRNYGTCRESPPLTIITSCDGQLTPDCDLTSCTNKNWWCGKWKDIEEI